MLEQYRMADHIEMIEVDPKLFITCRLCLEEMGVYQIVPTVQQQIKYCFEINVTPFDGLPQLLCKKCRVLLDEYSENKKKFVAKQESLITKLKVKQVTKIKSPDSPHSNEELSSKSRPDSVNSNSRNDNNIKSVDSGHSDEEHSSRTKLDSTNNSSTKKDDPLSIQPPSQAKQANNPESDNDENFKLSTLSTTTLITSNKKRARIVSNSSLDSEKSFVPKKKHLINSKKKLTKLYNKKFICNICTKTCKSRNRMFKHMYDHSYIRCKYKHIFNKPCRVRLNRVDNKNNSTDLNNTVVYDKEKIFQDAGNQLFHIVYTKRDRYSKKKLKSECIESSDEDFILTKNNKRKIRRISRSSNETVLIEDDSKISESCDGETLEPHSKTPENKVTECINIDDSSDESNTELVKHDHKEKPVEITVQYNALKTIENIITNCRLKYTKKLESSKPGNTEFESQLKHKILSIGRKNIHKEGHFNCTGLLRYMEHKNLDVIWLPKDQDKASRENLVRIMTKLKSASENDNTMDKNGWITVAEIESDKTVSSLNTIRALNAVCISDNTSISNVVPSAILTPSSISAATTDTFSTSTITPVANLDSAMLYKNCDTDVNSKKLLNQNPVANPKQLPKKVPNAVETKLINISSINVIDTTTNQSVIISLDDEQNADPGLVMPIITSTTSLAQESNVKKEDKEPEKIQIKTVPRIKVKPVSELMNPPNKINENQNGVWAMNRFENGVTPTQNSSMSNIYFQVVPQIQTVQSLQLPTLERSAGMAVSRINSETAVPRPEYITLNTVELPNTRTDSPFKYCKDLLLLHNIFLLDPTVNISQEYVNLLKIRVQFKQENKDKPVALCISLYCLRNSFCVCIKNSNNVDIPMTKISAKWQWEIIKLFQGEVSNKILENSLKAGQMVYLNTNTFICLLKSINCVQL
ncbi:unnamed protein product [Diatraea saccharalis]|uniref:ZAD domain-containing protein n=1 Tax=Diatraea saccharalis TaxID=40085 RepID=A0A9N9QTM2_9NEOP|nr:unnamed protein product [Diatraea saccharalis]